MAASYAFLIKKTQNCHKKKKNKQKTRRKQNKTIPLKHLKLRLILYNIFCFSREYNLYFILIFSTDNDFKKTEIYNKKPLCVLLYLHAPNSTKSFLRKSNMEII